MVVSAQVMKVVRLKEKKMDYPKKRECQNCGRLAELNEWDFCEECEEYEFDQLHQRQRKLKEINIQEVYNYAFQIAQYLWEKHYKNVSPNWKPLDNLMGVLSQISNMVTGLS